MRAMTVVAFIGELIETHMEKCEDVDHIISEQHKQSANITKIANQHNRLLVYFSDNTMADIRVEMKRS